MLDDFGGGQSAPYSANLLPRQPNPRGCRLRRRPNRIDVDGAPSKKPRVHRDIRGLDRLEKIHERSAKNDVIFCAVTKAGTLTAPTCRLWGTYSDASALAMRLQEAVLTSQPAAKRCQSATAAATPSMTSRASRSFRSAYLPSAIRRSRSMFLPRPRTEWCVRRRDLSRK